MPVPRTVDLSTLEGVSAGPGVEVGGGGGGGECPSVLVMGRCE